MNRNTQQNIHPDDILLSLVTPAFNEAHSLPHFVKKIKETFQTSSNLKIELIVINDGSTDHTLDILLELKKQYPIKILDLSRNFGKEAALSAGLAHSKGQIVVPIDADLQHPPELIFDMIEKWKDGFEVVEACRVDHKYNNSQLRSWFGNTYYWIHNKISHPKITINSGDFRLMDKAVVQTLNKLPESQRFMKGLFAWAGYRTTQIEYVCAKRIAGKSKFNAWKLWNFALEGLTSFSTLPLRIWLYFGFSISLLSLMYSMWILFKTLYLGKDFPGYASLIVAILFLGGIQLMGIGIIGEYLGRTYLESKRRPSFIIRRIL